LGRSFLGIDASPLALQTTRQRLELACGPLEERAFTPAASARVVRAALRR